MIDLLIYSSMFFVISYLYYRNFLLKIKLSNSEVKLIQLTMDNSVLKGKLEDCLNINNNKTDSDSEAFNKFISQSRDWAFSYIEDVQSKLKTFIEIADKEFAHFDRYGIVSEGQLFYETMLSISTEYKKLKDLLPKEEND